MIDLNQLINKKTPKILIIYFRSFFLFKTNENTVLFYICIMILHLPLFISGAEIAFIVFILVMVFGADKIPEIARGLGKGMRQVKDATNDIKREITESGQSLDIKNHSITKDIKGQIDTVKKEIDDLTGPIKRQF